MSDDGQWRIFSVTVLYVRLRVSSNDILRLPFRARVTLGSNDQG